MVAGRRAVLLVANAAAPYSRALRVARSLAGEGWEVEIAAVLEGDVPAEEQDAGILVRRYGPSGWADRIARALPRRDRGPRVRRLAARAVDLVVKGLLWPLGPRGWWATLRRDLPDADLYHAFGILAIPVALDLAAAARGRGGRPVVVYDVIDAILDSNNYHGVPAPVMAWYRWREARWVRRSDAVLAVNDALADHAGRIWPFRARPTVLLNCQPRRDSPPDPSDRPDHIRRAAGLPPERRVVLFLGRLGRDRGLESAAEAVRRLDDAALVMLGFPLHASWAADLEARSRDPRFAGRHAVLPPVHPDDVPDWAASADVSIIAVAASSLNQRLSTPNKFWESLAAGTPVVIGRDLEVMRAIVEADRLGAVADPADPDDLARALREVLDQPPEALAAMRERCLRVCLERYNWETAVGPYLVLVAALGAGSARG